ncbi:helix-turn-helix transcriptional regulator [Sphingomonas sp. LY54]|uniref:ArsR/SmtB family transcription factor n=1 Tax=Sphingomonas sp. LY54 TaxID=3095343 RepID=UPI002D765675|nr:helix-turn-helix transcriptional regulator [Sphingomonas sp. LY54]WRP29401.1 helix-turn-helix transcriptional regulator [Sphingomonas sp. LY54]
MSKAEALVDPAPVFAALGDRTRLSLLLRLSDGRARSITTLSMATNLTRQAVTKHLRVLEDVGLVAVSRVGRESLFASRPEALAEARSYLETVSAQWDENLTRLRSLVED